jgi:hypothetical protein
MTMLKIRRVAAVLASLVAVAVGSAGCSSAEDAGSGTTDDHLGESTAPLARFSPYLKSLKSTLESGGSTEQIANALLGSGRPAAFSLQALARLYDKADPRFHEMQTDFKGLEDGIGGYDKWNGIYRAAVSANKDAATLERLKQQSDDALVRFTKLLTDRQWITEGGAPTRIKMTEDFLQGFDWKTRADDRKLVLKQIIHELDDLDTTTYDMKILEYGNGIHELRRDLRWVLIDQLALNGMITLDTGACPIPAYAGVPSDNRYGALRSSATEPEPCQVSQCLVFKAANVVSSLGDLKDKAETEVNINGDADVVPEPLQAPAKAIYDDIVQNDLFGVYAGQLKACHDAL